MQTFKAGVMPAEKTARHKTTRIMEERMPLFIFPIKKALRIAFKRPVILNYCYNLTYYYTTKTRGKYNISQLSRIRRLTHLPFSWIDRISIGNSGRSVPGSDSVVKPGTELYRERLKL